MRSFRSVCALSLCLALGCGGKEPGTAKVAGKVTLDKVPIELGSVIIMTEDGKRSGSGAIGAGGAYLVPNAPLGKVKIALSLPPPLAPPNVPDAPEIKDDPKKMDKGDQGRKGVELPRNVQAAIESGAKLTAKVPPVYLSAAKSPLRFTVNDGDNRHDLELSTETGGEGAEAAMPPMPPMPPPPPE